MVVTDQAVKVLADNQVKDQESKELLGRAIGRIASGVYVLTLERNGQRDGLLATWIAQAAFDPPMLTVAIKKERHVLELMGVGTAFSVNVLSKANMDIFKSFARPFAEGLDRFHGLKLKTDGNAGPVFAEAVAHLDCRTHSMVEAGDHVLVVAEVTGGALLNGEAEPMVHLRKNGFQY